MSPNRYIEQKRHKCDKFCVKLILNNMVSRSRVFIFNKYIPNSRIQLTSMQPKFYSWFSSHNNKFAKSFLANSAKNIEKQRPFV